MSKLFLFLVLMFFAKTNNAQEINNGEELINMFRSSTVSLGQTQVSIDTNHHVSQKFVLSGTGVIFYLKGSKGTIPCVITAKHVIYDPNRNWYPTELQIRFYNDDTLSFNEYSGLKTTLRSGTHVHWFSLDDSNVDLACIPLIPGYNMDIEDSTILQKIHMIAYNNIAGNSDIFDGEMVMVLGYPGFATSNVLVKSILRQGIVSWTNPRKNISSPYLIDCNIFPGNSGGPVFTVPYGLRKKEDNNWKPMFGGIVTEVYYEKQFATDSTAKNQIYNFENKQIFVEQKAALGVVEPASRVRELLDYTSTYIKH